MLPARWAAANSVGVADIDESARPAFCRPDTCSSVSGSELAGQRLVERGTLPAVEDRVVGEVGAARRAGRP